MNPILTSPIVQFEYETDCGTAVGPPIAPVVPLAMMRGLREAYAKGTVWADRGRVIVLIEDPLGVVWQQPPTFTDTALDAGITPQEIANAEVVDLTENGPERAL